MPVIETENKTNQITRILKSKRALYDYSQSKMAELLGISTTNYALKERGKQKFKKTEIAYLKMLFHFTEKEEFFLQ